MVILSSVPLPHPGGIEITDHVRYRSSAKLMMAICRARFTATVSSR
jgi:hypothetical protein